VVRLGGEARQGNDCKCGQAGSVGAGNIVPIAQLVLRKDHESPSLVPARVYNKLMDSKPRNGVI
jgi:hypothetical protein